ncbi:phenylacetaldoxime dehydratase family protein [Agrobacterium vitis]|uniref:phenylacetaldoxime dehydratase family protein n=1 Tax=Agrobacterium vitis TaxID=373 RepID=UPI0012E8F4E6
MTEDHIGNAEELEPAIPDHLRRTRTHPLGAPSNFSPIHASYSARFGQDVTTLPIIYLGLQFPPGTNADLAIASIENAIAGSSGPEYVDRARFIDVLGCENLIFALYWRDGERFRQWRAVMPADWWYRDLPTEGTIGAFEEAFLPSVMDTETTFSHPHPDGYSLLADKMSGKTDTHEYWGSARDRIPRAQFDALVPPPADERNALVPDVPTKGRCVTVEPHDNLCLLRSGQDWSDTSGPERAFYLETVKTMLEAGMREIDFDGYSVGCFFNRYMQIEGNSGALEKTYSLSAWRSLADLEAWVKADTHLKIFAAGLRHYRLAGETAKLRLYHEMMVLKAEDQSFRYFNCHEQTGMLRSLGVRNGE